MAIIAQPTSVLWIEPDYNYLYLLTLLLELPNLLACLYHTLPVGRTSAVQYSPVFP